MLLQIVCSGWSGNSRLCVAQISTRSNANKQRKRRPLELLFWESHHLGSPHRARSLLPLSSLPCYNCALRNGTGSSASYPLCKLQIKQPTQGTEQTPCAAMCKPNVTHVPRAIPYTSIPQSARPAWVASIEVALRTCPCILPASAPYGRQMPPRGHATTATVQRHGGYRAKKTDQAVFDVR